MKLLIAQTARLIALCVVAVFAAAEPLSIKLPTETAKLRPSSLPGYALATQKCQICHSVDYIEYQPPGMIESQWVAEVRKMQHAYAAPITDDEINRIGAYLAASYSGKQAQEVGLQPSTAPVPSTQGATMTDVTTLLDQNSCLNCHAIDKKLVGPSYRDVAARYKNDPKAVDTLADRMGKGSSGRWGGIPMPPFPALTPDELKSLAVFVLSH